MKQLTAILVSTLLLIITGCWLYAFSVTYIPKAIEPIRIECPTDTAAFKEINDLKIMSYNVQFMAGRGYVFFHDLPKMAGPDSKPTQTSIDETLQRIKRLIEEENPDILLLQEMHQKHTTTYGRNQLAELQKALNHAYPCIARADYWRSKFVPHPKIMGPVGMELITLSKFKITDGKRYQLPQTPYSWITGPFHLQRAILEVDIKTDSQRALKVLNTHFEAFPKHSTVRDQQVNYAIQLLKSYDAAGVPWVFGGDLNLIPDRQRERLSSETYLYPKAQELQPLLENYSSIPNKGILNSPNPSAWYTYSPNRFESLAPDRTLDYIFYSAHWRLLDAKVRTDELAQLASDHMPVLGQFRLLPYEVN